MRHLFVLTLVAIALLACGQTTSTIESYTGESALQKMREAEQRFYQDRSTPENVASTPGFRDLFPPDAASQPYPQLEAKDAWVVRQPLEQVVLSHGAQMRGLGFSSYVSQCSPKSIWGGRLLIRQHCSADGGMTAQVTLAEERESNSTVMTAHYRAWTLAESCDSFWSRFVSDRARRSFIAGCPIRWLH